MTKADQLHEAFDRLHDELVEINRLVARMPTRRQYVAILLAGAVVYILTGLASTYVLVTFRPF